MWSKTFKEEFGLSHFIIGDMDKFNKRTPLNLSKTIYKEISEQIGYKILSTLYDLLEKIKTKNYTAYKKYTPYGYITKEIIYAHDVKGHKRHFWKDSGKFKIPFMSKEELETKGYGIDELVFRDEELRRDVPFKKIDSFKVGIGKKEIKENRRINLLQKRILRQEEKLLKILQDIFPTDIIKRHDRKILKGLELDFLIKEKRLAFEYDGEQHYNKKVCENIFKSNFDELKRRDRIKNRLCRKKSMILIRIKYNEPLNKRHVLSKIPQPFFNIF